MNLENLIQKVYLFMQNIMLTILKDISYAGN